MAESLFSALSTAAAWWLAFRYVRMESKAALFYTGLIAVVCGGGIFFFYSIGLLAVVPLVVLLFFLLITFAVSIQQQGKQGDAVLAFLLAQGGYSLLSAGESALYRWGGMAGLALACVMPGVFLLLTVKLMPLFPASDWRDYYTEATPEPGRVRLKLPHNYLIAAGRL